MSKSVAKNAIFNMFYKALSVVFPLITVAYASRILGAAGIGNVSSAQNLVTYFIMFAALGIPSYGVKAIAQSKKNQKECDKTFSELLVINAVSSIIFFAAYFVLIAIINRSATISVLNIIFSLLIALNILNVEWLYQGFEEYKYIATRSLIVKIISLIFLVIFVRDSDDIVQYACVVCFGTAGNYILNLVQLNKHVKIELLGLNYKRHIKPILIFFASVLAIELYSLLDITMLTYMTTPEHVGYYSNATKIIKTIANTITAIGAVLLPRLSLCFGENNKDEAQEIVNNFFNVIMLIAIPSCVGILCTSNQLVDLLFGNDFYPAISTIRILSPLIILMPLSGGIFGQILLTSGEEKNYLKCVFTGAVTNAILNVLFIIMFKHNGAAIASTITEVFVCGTMIWFCRRSFKLKEKSIFISIVLSAFIMGMVVLLIKSVLYNVSVGVSLIVEICCGVLIYIFLLVVLKNKIILIVLNKVANIIRIKKN